MTVRRLLAVVAWALLVLLCSTGVWGVIRTAGTGVTTSPEIPSATTGAGPTADRATTSARPHAPSHAPSSRPKPTTSTGPTPTSAVETGDSSTQHTQGPTEVRRTWQGTAGAVVASCRGATITFRGAQANSGWRVEVGNRGPEEIEVHFSRLQRDDAGDDGDSTEVELKSRCVGGEPRFSTSGD